MALGMSIQRSGYRKVRKRVSALGLDTSHWDKRHLQTSRPPRSLSEVMVENSTYTTSNLKRRILKEGLLDERCSVCGMEALWNGKPLVLVLDHINGISNDHRMENLRFLCPNCNSQTETFAGRKLKKVTYCLNCGELIQKRSLRCRRCAGRASSKCKTDWPPFPELQRMVEEKGYSQVGKELGVSGNAVSKRLRKASV